MNIQNNIEMAWRLFKENAVLYILASFIISLLVPVTLCLLIGPLLGGFTYMALNHVKGEKSPQFNDLFYGFQEIGSLFFYLVTLLFILLGFLLFLLPGIILSVWWIYALPIMVDRKLGFIEAMEESKRIVQDKAGFLPTLGFAIILFILPPLFINALSSLFPPFTLLNLAVLPLQILALLSSYAEIEKSAVTFRNQGIS